MYNWGLQIWTQGGQDPPGSASDLKIDLMFEPHCVKLVFHEPHPVKLF